jgi:hypothetical protein
MTQETATNLTVLIPCGRWRLRALNVAVACSAGCLALKAQAVDVLPSIDRSRKTHTAKITFAGNLESAATVNGPWSAILDADNPYVVDVAGAQSGFIEGGDRMGPIAYFRPVLR